MWNRSSSTPYCISRIQGVRQGYDGPSVSSFSVRPTHLQIFPSSRLALLQQRLSFCHIFLRRTGCWLSKNCIESYMTLRNVTITSNLLRTGWLSGQSTTHSSLCWLLMEDDCVCLIFLPSHKNVWNRYLHTAYSNITHTHTHTHTQSTCFSLELSLISHPWCVQHYTNRPKAEMCGCL